MKIIKNEIRDVKTGSNVKIIEPVNIYECFIDDNVFIGPFVEIQKGVKIGKKSKIQSHTFICEKVSIGSMCFIGHGVMFINDKFNIKNGPAEDQKLWGETVIKDKVSIGSNATILPVNICSNVVIGAGSVVTKNILRPGVYAGNPANLIKKL